MRESLDRRLWVTQKAERILRVTLSLVRGPYRRCDRFTLPGAPSHLVSSLSAVPELGRAVQMRTSPQYTIRRWRIGRDLEDATLTILCAVWTL